MGTKIGIPQLTREKVREILAALAPDNKVWVAGSAAIVPELAKDIDVWVTAKSALTSTAFKAGNPDATEVDPTYPGSDIPVTAKFDYYHEGIKVQIMFVDCNIWSLLDKFDISCHAFARDFHGNVIKHHNATFPGIEDILIKEDASQYTKDRKEIFTNRYDDTSKFMPWLSA